MGLNWLNIFRKNFSSSEEGKPAITNEVAEIERILLIGFGKVPGFHCVNWQDWEWANAAVFDVTFINCGSLYNLLLKWKNEYSEDEENFPLQPFDRLKDNLDTLSKQILQIINSNRSIYVFATPNVWFQVRRSGSYYGFVHSSISVYSWCPLLVEVVEEVPGEVITNINPQFEKYCHQIKKWQFHFGNKPKSLDSIDKSDLSPGQEYIQFPISLFETLSLQPLGIELRYGVFDQAKMTSNVKLDVISGPLYLLHFPVGGDLKAALRSLLQEFCKVDLLESTEPEWIHTVSPPRGLEINEQINELSNKIADLAAEKTNLQNLLQQMEYWRRLLYESGEALEDVVLEALKLLGLDNARFGLKGDHDIAGEIDGETVVFEAKGLNRSAGRKEVFALDRHKDEFELKNPQIKVAKCVLVANTYRQNPPSTRETDGKQIFTSDAVEHAKLLGFALLDTRILYKIAKETIEREMDNNIEFLKALKNTTGIYVET